MNFFQDDFEGGAERHFRPTWLYLKDFFHSSQLLLILALSYCY